MCIIFLMQWSVRAASPHEPVMTGGRAALADVCPGYRAWRVCGRTAA